MVADPQESADGSSTDASEVSGNPGEPDSNELWAGLQPAYRCSVTGEIHLSVTSDGSLSERHSFEGLPPAWIAQRDDRGRALALHSHVIAGFWRSPYFIDIASTIILPMDA